MNSPCTWHWNGGQRCTCNVLSWELEHDKLLYIGSGNNVFHWEVTRSKKCSSEWQPWS